MTTGKNHSFDYMDFISKVMPLLFNTLSRFVIAFFPRSKCIPISWLQSPSAVILEPKKIKSATASIYPSSICLKGWDRMPWSLFFECWVLSQLFHSPLLPLSTRSLVPLPFLPLEEYHLHIWGCWYFSLRQSWFQLLSHLAWHFAWEQVDICSWVTAFARRGNGGAQLSWGDLQEATFRGSGGLN